MKFLLGLALIFVSPSESFAERLPFSSLEYGLQKLVVEMRLAAKEKNPYPIYRAISPKFMLERDFGGMFNPIENAVWNFSTSFQFDENQIRPEYRGAGWKIFQSYLSGNDFERLENGEICTPFGAQAIRPYPHGQICFSERRDGKWELIRHIKGGD